MRDYLINSNQIIEFDLFENINILEVKAIQSHGSEEGEIPTVYAPGNWHLISVNSDETLHNDLKPFMVGYGDRDKGLNLPSGIVSLSNVWAGMTLNIKTV